MSSPYAGEYILLCFSSLISLRACGTVYHMISITRRGQYRLIQIQKQTKVLILDNKDIFLWQISAEQGEVLKKTHSHVQEIEVLAEGPYRFYEIDNEDGLIDGMHLELLVGEGRWQGYLLPEGIPSDSKKIQKHYHISPTKETITKVMVGEQYGLSWL